MQKPKQAPEAIDPAMQALIEQRASAPDEREFADQAHSIGHRIGKDSDAPLSELFARCGDPEFAFGGCLHGVVMGHDHHGNLEDIAKQCQETTFETELYNRNCAHGVGHGVFSGGTDLNKFLNECSGMFGTVLEPDCQSGVMMEYMLRTHSIAMGAERPAMRLPDCSALREDFRLICAGAAGAYSQYYPDSSIEATVDICQQLGVQEYTEYCYQTTLSRLVAAPEAKTEQFCRLSKADHALCRS